MKRLFLTVAALSIFLCGCTQTAPSYSKELTESTWGANLDGGAELSLSFSGEPGDMFADLSIKNAGISADISGRCLADEESFVIFDTESAQNYAFEYTPKGSTLEISYNNAVLTLQKQG